MSDYTKKYLDKIVNLLSMREEDSLNIAEIQCGEAYNIEHCQVLQEPSKIGYIGLDVVDSIIRDNRYYFVNDKNKTFITLDASNEPIPQADVVVCMNMLEYLPIANIWSLLENVRESQSTYFAVSYYLQPINQMEINCEMNWATQDNEVKLMPQPRAVNLCVSPFYFPQPLCLIPLDEQEKFIAIYDIKESGYFMDWHNEPNAKLRSQLYPILLRLLKIVEKQFSKYEDGLKLLEEAMCLKKDWNWEKVLYNKTYENIIGSSQPGYNEYINLHYLMYSLNYEWCSTHDDIFSTIITKENIEWASIIARDFCLWYFRQDLYLHID